MPGIAYRVVRSDRRTIAIQIMPDGSVVVRCPRNYPDARIRSFVESKAAWIAKHQKPTPVYEKLSQIQLQQMKAQAAEVIRQRLDYYAPIVGVTYGRVTIRSQRTRWGSCSAKGNLNFNCLLMLCPEAVQDYVVIHELCHRKEMNHSSEFWAEVEKYCPDYRIYRKWLKDNGASLIARLP